MKSILLLLTLLISLSMQAQFGPQQVISDSFISADNAIPFDIDADGFMDVLATSYSEDKVSWYRNTDGMGDFGEEIVIFQGSVIDFVNFVDIDTDGDRDILYKARLNNNIGWLENMDGAGTFGPEQILITGTSDILKAVSAEDIDGDGDIDILTTFIKPAFDAIIYFLNEDGLGSFGPPVLLYEYLFDEIAMPITADIDHDGDLDLLASYRNNGPHRLVWYETTNLLNPFEIEHVIYQLPFFSSDWTKFTSFTLADITTDGIDDIILTTHNADFDPTFIWIEALDDEGNFDLPQDVISFPAPHRKFSFHDLDNDGDQDLLRHNYSGDDLYWVRNDDGLGDFNTPRIFTNEVELPRSTNGADFNGDGIMDVVSASAGDNKIAWYENTGVLGISDNKARKFSISPNPTKNKITINGNEALQEATLFNQLGQSILTFNDKSQISLESLASGIYFLRITSDLDISEVHKIIKE